jgi:type I restriction enzyme S subunit
LPLTLPRSTKIALAWEQRKLGDVTTRIVRKNKTLESTLPLTISSIYGLVDQITYFNNRVASRDVSNYYLIKQGEFAYNKSYSDGFPWGSVKRLDRYDMGVLSTLYIVFTLNADVVDSDYLVSYYETDNWHREVALRAAEGARNHGLLNISAEDFFDTALKYPKEISEQVQTGTFFKTLDNLITLHQRKLKKHPNMKKILNEKMFV